MTKFAKIVLSKNLVFVKDFLTYSFDNSNLELNVGDIVEIPLGRQKITGVVFDIFDKLDISSKYKIKNIISKLPHSINVKYINLSKQISEYYFAPLHHSVKLFIQKNIWNNSYSEKVKTIWKLNKNIFDKVEKLRGDKQKKIIKYLEEVSQVEQSELIKNIETNTTTLKNLEEKGIINKSIVKISNKPFLIKNSGFHKLSKEQNEVFENLKKHKKVLLHWVTWSGKTEVLLHFFKWIYENNSEVQNLFLVPEISLTPQMIEYFYRAFPYRIAIIHSKISDNEKCRIWKAVQSWEIKLIIWSRSAIFLPWKNLNTIVIDEAHEWNYKSEQIPKYNTKWIAEQLYPKHLILSSATPDFCDMYNKDYNLLELKNRVNNVKLPKITVVDMRNEFLRKNFSPISVLLEEKINKTLEKWKQVILFLNKRGYSSALQCKECGEIIKCPRCDIPVKYYNKNNKTICHYCFLTQDAPNKCPNCNSTSIKQQWYWTQRLEELLNEKYPDKKIIRVDRDSTIKKDAFENIYNSFKSWDWDILIGTQMISKGLNLPDVKLVWIISTDTGLHIPDFRSEEKVFQLLLQVSWRAGRYSEGEVIFQTYNPNNKIIKFATNHDYNSMFKEEIIHRKKLKYPPFSKVIKLIHINQSKQDMINKQAILFNKLQNLNSNNNNSMNLIITTAPSFIPKINNKFYWNIIIRWENPEKILKNIDLNCWFIDRDPIILS